MTTTLVSAVVVTFLTLAADDPPEVGIDLSGHVEGRGLALAESERPVFRVQVLGSINEKGSGKGTLILDATPRIVDEFGFSSPGDPVPPIKLDCTLRLLKKSAVVMAPAGVPRQEVTYYLYELSGPKISSRITLATEGKDWSYARVIVADKDGKNRVAVNVHPPLYPPCHPGCFPAGTPILTPDGEVAIETIRVGDAVSTVDEQGGRGKAKVTALFITVNRLLEIQTNEKTLMTTTTQPLALVAGGLRAAEGLKVGDKLYIWNGRARAEVAVRAVTPTKREARVYNLVLGEPVLFVADGFLARSKPPGKASEVVAP